MGKRFIPEDAFSRRWQREADMALEVSERMSRGGRTSGHLTRFDFHFVSNQEAKLIKLQQFLSEHYPYTFEQVKKHGWRRWCLDGQTNEFPYTKVNLFFWALDMFDRGFDHDAELEAYGSLFDPNDVRVANFDSKDEDHYFDLGMKAYDSGNRSGALIAWNHVVSINSKNADAIYSRAIVKAELYDCDGAMQDYNRALEIAPDFWSALANRGCLKDEIGDHAGAIKDHTLVIEGAKKGGKNYISAYANRGNSKQKLGDLDSACADWKTAEGLGADFVSERIAKHCRECE